MASPTSGDATKKKSIVIVDMPEEFINREILKTHFEQFGTVERLACSVSKKYAVVHFSTEDEAKNASANGTRINPDSAPLKIYNRAVTAFGPSKSTEPTQPSTASATSTHTNTSAASRLVTRRKIVRTFNTSSGSGTAKTYIQESSLPSTSESSSVSIDVPDSDSLSIDQEPTASSSSVVPRPGPGPLRASVKISRPTPFLRRKPSYGDRSVKTNVVNRNPFSLPPRSKLSIDRRKTTISPPKVNLKPEQESQGEASLSLDHGADNSSNIQEAHLQEPASSSAEILLPDDNVQPANKVAVDDETRNEPKTTIDPSGSVAEAEPSSTLDIDETTEDALLNEDDEDNDGANWQVDKPEATSEASVFVEGEADTQDTAEVSTEEEEGEIQDDEDDEQEEYDEERNEEGDDDVYESPLKRAEEKSTGKEETASTSGGPFSFKLGSAKSSQSASSGPSSLFNLPFTSPFALGDAPKPFSSTSFGIQLNPGNMSKIFAGTSATSNTPDKTSSEATQEKPKSSKSSSRSSTPVPAKKEVEAEKPKPAFGLFSSAFSGITTFGGSKPTLSKLPSNSGFGSGSVFSASKPSTSISSSSSTSFPSLNKEKVMKSSLPAMAKPFVPSSSTSMAAKKVVGTSGTSSAAPVLSASVALPPKDTPNPLLLTFNPDTSEAQELFGKRSNTSEERYRILEARDKLIRARIPKTKVNVEHAKKLIGTCPDMCPEKERYMRQFQRQLVPYETLPGQDHVVDHQKAIKVYSRSSADQEEPLPHELRPGPTLDYTMHYLLNYIVPLGDNPDENLSDWYNFLWDRTRSIRKDITQQQILDLTAVCLYEKCARFHIHCASRLCELDVHSFDPKLNDENLMKCLQSLEHLYEDLRRRQVICPNEPEFRAYQIMMNLNEGDALYNAQQLPSWILNSNQVQTALKLHHSIYTKNFVAFFRAVDTLPYMTACILHRYFFQVRSLALRCFIKAHCTLPKYETAMPIGTLQRMLGYGSEVQSFSYLCEAHGIHCDIEENRVILKKKLFYLPEFPSIYREHHLIDSKLQTSVAEAINGEPLPDIDFGNRKPHSSFDENGQLLAGAIIGSEDSRSGVFAPPEPIAVTRAFSKPVMQAPASSGGFPFSIFSQQRKEPVPPPKPLRQIETVCETAALKLIDESVRDDVKKVSTRQLEEAKRMQEIAAKVRLREQIATKLSLEYVERAISQHVHAVVQNQSASQIRQFRIIDELAESTADTLIHESVLINLGISARTELILAKEYHHRLIRTLERIFQRLRARFAAEKWKRFTQTKILEREREEERRREELWNFPAINSYGISTHDVFRAFCGKSPVQLSLNKIESISDSPERMPPVRIGLKRKSADKSSLNESSSTSNKSLRLNPVVDVDQENKNKQMWEFPAVSLYNRTNREVLEALCGKSCIGNLPASSEVPTGEKRKSNGFFPNSDASPFKIHRPAEKLDVGRGLGQEIRQRANEGDVDLLHSIQNFLSVIKDEKEQLERLEPYRESVEAMKQTCPELNISVESIHPEQQSEVDSESEFDHDYRNDWTRNSGLSDIFSGTFTREGQLLQQIQKFSRAVKEEKKKSWDTDTFLNEIDYNFEI